ncbi:DivIVA domain-containing protein [Canibacter zhoujuaniae]|uniref:DivIVA domain-containing protein n=1 Tax=Canibacter zhoujuaniae TaxID=2708343 RepID=UPI0014208994|nr:DivIVA domain-containing protein [Canibacter zhoujuaniae]
MSRNEEALPLAVGGELGYNTAQVDELFAKARAAYEGEQDGAVTADDLRTVSFKLQKNGYAARYVDAALERLEDVFAARAGRNSNANSESAVIEAEKNQLAREVANRLMRPRGEKFRRRNLLTFGYRRSQVDAFLERVAAGLAGESKLSISQVREAVFFSEWRGYDEAQVDALLDSVVELLLYARS